MRVRGTAILAAVWSGTALGQPLTLVARDSVDLGASAVDQFGAAFPVTGLSGVSSIGETSGVHRFIAVMDNSNKLVQINATFESDGALASAAIVGGVTLSDTRDFEGIVFTGAERGTVLLSEEGTPSIREYRLSDGAFVDAWETPPVFASRRDNFGWESLTAADAGAVVWTANEEALTVDGALATPSAGSVVRLLRYDDGAPGVQFAYVTAPLHGLAISGSRSGLSDLVLLPSGRLVSLERSLALASPLFLTRIYEIDFEGATDVSGVAGLSGSSYTPVGKRLLYRGGQTNLEGLCLGPRLDGGNWSMVGVVDDADPVSVNRLAAFELSGPVEGPACVADWDGSGVVNSQDFFAFLADFFSRGADVNADGVTDSRDFFEYLAAFFAGC